MRLLLKVKYNTADATQVPPQQQLLSRTTTTVLHVSKHLFHSSIYAYAWNTCHRIWGRYDGRRPDNTPKRAVRWTNKTLYCGMAAAWIRSRISVRWKQKHRAPLVPTPFCSPASPVLDTVLKYILSTMQHCHVASFPLPSRAFSRGGFTHDVDAVRTPWCWINSRRSIMIGIPYSTKKKSPMQPCKMPTLHIRDPNKTQTAKKKNTPVKTSGCWLSHKLKSNH